MSGELLIGFLGDEDGVTGDFGDILPDGDLRYPIQSKRIGFSVATLVDGTVEWHVEEVMPGRQGRIDAGVGVENLDRFHG